MKKSSMNTRVFLALLLSLCSSICFSQTNVRAWYADGQVFVLWELAPEEVETYAIYASPTPFTDVNEAAQVGRLFWWEYTGHALKDNSLDTTATFVIPDGLGDHVNLELNEGLFVFTPHQADSLYFAVTKWGEDEVVDGQNITDTAVEFSFDPEDDPVECHLQRVFPSPFDSDFLCFAFYMWADGRQNHWEGRPDFPIMANAAKNGMPSLFLLSVPNDLDTTVAYPLSVWLHGCGGPACNARQSLAGNRASINIDPEEGILLAHNDRFYGYRGATPPSEDQPSWHFGWSKNYNPFFSTALSADTVINYTQRRYLWIDEWLAKSFNIDPHQIHIHGHSMGAAGATAMAKCHPEHYASATLFNTSCKGPQNAGGTEAYLGSFEDSFPTNLHNRNDESVRIWDVWDLYSNCSAQRDLPVFRYWHGKQDDNEVNHWGPVAVENYIACDSLGTGLQGFWSERDHGVGSPENADDHWIIGNIPVLQTAFDNVDFAEGYYHNNVSYPAFFNHRMDSKNNDPGVGFIGIDNGDGDNWGTWGGYHRWENVVETSEQWEVVSWLESSATYLNDRSPEDFLTADLAIRRPQTFTPDSGSVVNWMVEDLETGDVLQSGSSTVQMDDLVVIPQVEVFREAIRKVLITITDASTSVDEQAYQVGDLRIIPNPTYESIYTEPSWNTIDIMDLHGRVLQRIESGSSNGNVDVSFLASGIYLLRVATWEGTRRTGKFIKS